MAMSHPAFRLVLIFLTWEHLGSQIKEQGPIVLGTVELSNKEGLPLPQQSRLHATGGEDKE